MGRGDCFDLDPGAEAELTNQNYPVLVQTVDCYPRREVRVTYNHKGRINIII